ncbi:MAG: cation diffusion facilitator family transporter [Polyangiales bacterium]
MPTSEPRPAQSTGHIVQSLVVNVAIAAVKLAAAVFTRSGSMLAEALHSCADCANQVLLLIGVRSARRPPDATHPLGHGRELYFWSFLVALLLFMGGGVFSVREGVHKLLEPEPVEHVGWGIGVLVIGLGLEGTALWSNVREMNRRRGAVSFMQYLHDTKDSDLVVIFGENGADVLGLSLSLAALGLAWRTGDGRWDGAGSVLIGVVLVAVAAFLAREVKSLLVGEAADPQIHEAARLAARDDHHIERVLDLITIQQGPNEALVAIKLAFAPHLSIDQVCHAINDFEERLRALRPDVKWCFVEPDIPRDDLVRSRRV